MRQRYGVLHNRKWFASVHAVTAEEAIRTACRMTGTQPEGSTAVEVRAGRSEGTGR